MGIIRDIIDTNRDINSVLQNGKMPLFFRKKKTEHDRNRLLKYIDGIKEDPVPIELIQEYIEILPDYFPPYGRLYHCEAIHNGLATFKYDILKTSSDGYDCYADIKIDNQNKVMIRITILHNGQKQISFIDNPHNMINSFEEDDTDDIDLRRIAIEARNQLRIILVEDIKNFLKNIIQTQERINL